MIDIHSHLLYGVDDGCVTITESLEILKDLRLLGYSDIILTPHYIRNSKYNSSRNNNLNKLNALKRELKKNNIDINLYLGNEIYIDNDILKLLEDNLISSLNNTDYLLIELPMSGEYLGDEDIFLDIIKKGKKVVLAHPERYFAFQKDFKLIYDLEKIGVLFQSNIESIVGGYGKKAQKMMKRLLKEKKIHFLGTDIHHKKDYSIWNKARKQIIKYIGNNEYNILMKNAMKLLDRN